MRQQRAALSRHAPVAKATDYMLTRWEEFTTFLHDGRACLTNNAAERALCGVALGRKAWLFAGSDRGGERAAILYGMIVTAKMNDIDPQAWLADVFARINDIPQKRLHERSGRPSERPNRQRPPGRQCTSANCETTCGAHRMDTVDMNALRAFSFSQKLRSRSANHRSS